MAIIEFKDVYYAYQSGDGSEVPAVNGINFSVEEGEFIALIGRNGSGKSTIARLSNGLLLPDRGDIFVDGNNTLDKSKLFDIRKTVGVVFQNPDNQMISTIVEDDVAFGPENLGLAPSEIRERVDFALDSVGMREYARSSPYRLSGGQKQRIAIAGVLAVMPRVMFLDEATGMLDPDGRVEVMNVVRKLNKLGITVITITHFPEEAALCDRVIVMDEGKICMQGGREVLYKSEELASVGLSSPLCARMALKLKSQGIDVGTPYTNEELIDAIAKADV